MDIDMSTINHTVACMAQSIAADMAAPHVLMRPAVFKDGDAWCALYGEDLQMGVAGFGDNPSEACVAFDREWQGAHQ